MISDPAKRIQAAIDAVHNEHMRTLVDAPDAGAPQALVPLLQSAGFDGSVEAETAFRSMCLRVFSAGHGVDIAAVIVASLLDAPSPDAALLNLERYFDRLGDPGVFFTTIATAPPVLEMVTVVLGGSQYMADIIVRNPNLVYWLMEAGTWSSDDTALFYRNWLEREAALFQKVEGKLGAVRRAHRQALLKIGILDMLGRASVEDTTGRLSNLADAIAQVVLDVVRQSLRGDRTDLPDDLAVIAMGKLGGAELNYSSDIDLLYVCADGSDETIAWHMKVARHFGEALSEHTGEGYLYRVDLRLRPDGKAGPLVNTETSFRIYYENRGRPWEFQALLKARVIAGNRKLGDGVLGALGNLVYSPSLSYSPLERVAAMRQQITNNIPAHERGLNIKLMSGGIRDVEFIAQALQLVHGSTHKELRTGNTLTALHHVARFGFLDRIQVDNLAAAYRFLRLVEHRLQMMHQIKTHTVPASPEQVTLLARRVARGPVPAFPPEQFLDILSRHIGNVRAISESFFAGEAVDPNVMLLMLPEDDERVSAILAAHGIKDTGRAMRALHTLAYGSFPRLLERGARKALEELLPSALKEIEGMGDPVSALIHLSEIAAAGRSEASFYRLLIDSAPARSLVLGIAGFSSVLTRRLCNQIETLDALLQSTHEVAFQSQFRELPEWDRFNAAMARAGGRSAEERREKQRGWFDRTRLHAFAVNYRNQFRHSGMGRARAWAAARQIAAAFDSVFGDASGIALFAMGSYAVDEPRMTSDLDLVVVTDGADIPEVSSGVQLINSWFTDGNILKLDFRLRGEGASAPLVQDVSYYGDYFAGRMALWERVAFSKCRPWWGDAATQEKFLTSLRSAVAKPFEPDGIATLAAVRARVETLAPTRFPGWDTKRVAGGRYDIEYITAIGMAACAHDEAEFFSLTTAQRLKRIAAGGFLSAKESESCRFALTAFGVVEYLMELQAITHPRSEERNEYLSGYLDRSLRFLRVTEESAEQLLARARADVRRTYERVIAQDG